MDDLCPHVIDCFTRQSELNELKLVCKLFESLCQSRIKSLSLKNYYSKIHRRLFVSESNRSAFTDDPKIVPEFDWIFLHDMGIWIKIRVIESKIVMFFAPGLLDYRQCKNRCIQCDPGFVICDKVEISDAFYWNRDTRLGSFFVKFKQLGNDTYHLIMDLSNCESPLIKLRKCDNIDGSCDCKEPIFDKFQTINYNFAMCRRPASVAPTPMISLIDALDTTFEIYVHWGKVWISDKKFHSTNTQDDAQYEITGYNGGLRCLGSFGPKNRFLLFWNCSSFAPSWIMVYDLLTHEKSNIRRTIPDNLDKSLADDYVSPSFTWDRDEQILTLIYASVKIRYSFRNASEKTYPKSFYDMLALFNDPWGNDRNFSHLIHLVSAEMHSDPVLKESTFIYDPLIGENIQFVHPSSYFDGLNR